MTKKSSFYQAKQSPFPVGGQHTFHTGGPGSWLKQAKSAQQPKEQVPPTPAMPIRLHKMMTCPK